MTTTAAERPLRVWLYRDWCWICRRCQATGWGLPSQTVAYETAVNHLPYCRCGATTTRKDER